jgi:hypothetical protein
MRVAWQNTVWHGIAMAQPTEGQVGPLFRIADSNLVVVVMHMYTAVT